MLFSPFHRLRRIRKRPAANCDKPNEVVRVNMIKANCFACINIAENLLMQILQRWYMVMISFTNFEFIYRKEYEVFKINFD